VGTHEVPSLLGKCGLVGGQAMALISSGGARRGWFMRGLQEGGA
jgi:hypothetical protein